jgi:hypothetical protein
VTPRARLPQAVRAGYGLFLLASPHRLLAIGAPLSAPTWAPGIVRILGARHVLQAAALTVLPDLGRFGAGVDLAHAATDVGCVAAVPALRAPALLDTAVASALAASAWTVARRRRNRIFA